MSRHSAMSRQKSQNWTNVENNMTLNGISTDGSRRAWGVMKDMPEPQKIGELEKFIAGLPRRDDLKGKLKAYLKKIKEAVAALGQDRSSSKLKSRQFAVRIPA